MKPSPYGPFPYSPIISRPKLAFPGGAHVALWVIPNIEFFPLNAKVPGGTGAPAPDIPAWSVRDYGNRVGVFRIMQTLDRHGIRATVALNSDVCRYHPEIIAEGRKRNWEWMGHCETNARRLNELPPGEEARVIRDSFKTIAEATGARPAGWLGAGLQETWDTLDLLAAEGCDYVCDWTNDEQPYLMTLEGGRTLVSVPYSYDINDIGAFERRHRTADEFRDMICRQFDVLYRDGADSGRVMAICLHPFLTGMPYRIGALEEALAYIGGHARVWKTTGGEIARHYRAKLGGSR